MSFSDFVDNLIEDFFMPLPALLIGAGIVFLFWNIFQVITKADQPDELVKFKSRAVWGIVALAVMVSVWGLVNFVTSSIELDSGGISLPQYNISF